jgi:hypothetical protein
MGAVAAISSILRQLRGKANGPKVLGQWGPNLGVGKVIH